MLFWQEGFVISISLLRKIFRDRILMRKTSAWAILGFWKSSLIKLLFSTTRIGVTIFPWSWSPDWLSPRDQPSYPDTLPFRYHLLSWSPFWSPIFLRKQKSARTPRSVAFPTVHDRGLGYSNRLTLCRGGVLSPHQIGHRRGSTHGLPDDNTSNVETLIKTFHYVRTNTEIPRQLGYFSWHRMTHCWASSSHVRRPNWCNWW